MPYPLRGLRVIVTVLWLTAIDAVVMVALELKASEPVMLAILAPHVPLAYLAARFAVARARRGDVPDWRRRLRSARTDRAMSCRGGEPHFLRPPARRRGSSGGGMAGRCRRWSAILLPFELALLFVFRDTPAIVFEILLGVLLTPPFMAAFVAATVEQVESPEATPMA